MAYCTEHHRYDCWTCDPPEPDPAGASQHTVAPVAPRPLFSEDQPG
jgi:hypothetical protein